MATGLAGTSGYTEYRLILPLSKLNLPCVESLLIWKMSLNVIIGCFHFIQGLVDAFGYADKLNLSLRQFQ